jgi:hypothetical protein
VLKKHLRLGTSSATCDKFYQSGCTQGFAYTTIQFKKDYAAFLHTDSNHEGPSYIVALGDFSGGELFVYDPEADMLIANETSSWRSLGQGWLYYSRAILDVHNKFVGFDGKSPHMTRPFKADHLKNSTRLSS